jgi:hypothetical protein
MATQYVSKAAYDAVTQWATGAKSLGAYVRPTTTYIAGVSSSIQNLYERVWKVTTAGTSSGTEPSWPLNPADGATLTDGTVTWTHVTGRESEQVSGNWKAPWRCITEAHKRSSGVNDMVYVANDHDYTSPNAVGAIIYNNAPGTHITVSVNYATASIPPTRAQWLAGAVERTTVNDNLIIATGAWYGIRFTAGSGTGFAALTIGGSQVGVYCDTCNFEYTTTSSSRQFNVGTTAALGRSEMVNCQFKFADAGQNFNFGGSEVLIRDNPSSRPLIEAGGVAPTTTTLFTGTTAALQCTFRNVDMSSLASPVLIPGGPSWNSVIFENCKLPVGIPQNFNTASITGSGAMVGSDDSTGNKKNRFYMVGIGGVWVQDTTIARVGGADDGTDKWSIRFVPTNSASANQGMSVPAKSPSVMKRILTSGSPIVCTIYGICFDTAMPTKRELALALQYIADSASPLGSTATTFDLSDVTTLTADTSDWTAGTVAARANSTSYGTVTGPFTGPKYFKVASNAGRIFYCSTSGTSAASEPGGYLTAVDGGSITDGTATIKAGWRFKLALTITPAQASVLRATLLNHQTLTETITFWFDPKLDIV